MKAAAFWLTKEGRILWLAVTLAIVCGVVAAVAGRPRPLAEGVAAGAYSSWALFVIGRWPHSPSLPSTPDLLSGLGSGCAIGVLAWTGARGIGAAAPALWRWARPGWSCSP